MNTAVKQHTFTATACKNSCLKLLTKGETSVTSSFWSSLWLRSLSAARPDSVSTAQREIHSCNPALYNIKKSLTQFSATLISHIRPPTDLSLTHTHTITNSCVYNKPINLAHLLRILLLHLGWNFLSVIALRHFLLQFLHLLLQLALLCRQFGHLLFDIDQTLTRRTKWNDDPSTFTWSWFTATHFLFLFKTLHV